MVEETSGTARSVQSPLIDAVRANDPATAKRLIAQMTDPKERNAQCWNAFMVLMTEYSPLKAHENALERSSSTVSGNHLPLLPLLHLLWPNGVGGHMQSGDGRMVWEYINDLLLRYGADPNGPSGRKGQPLSYALLLGDSGEDIVRSLLKHGASVNIPDEQGVTPLMVAATQDVNTVRLLLRHGAHPNARAQDGRTPLSSVDGQPASEPIRTLLMEAGANN
jgi:ankyrin repeat protein